MKLYIAAVYTNDLGFHGSRYLAMNEHERAMRATVDHVLDSYHYIHKDKYVDHIRRDGAKVFLDSGAFSAFTQGYEIDLPGYCRYIERNRDIIEVASVLDGIGDPLKTYQNQWLMEQAGVDVLPCFHYGEDERYLEHYIAHYSYITLGGMVPISTPQLRLWLDRIWEHWLTDKQGRPRLRVHGFGLTTVSLMERYPWYSVDSSSWMQTARTGGIYLPGLGTIPISENNPSRHEHNRHFDTLVPAMQERVRHEIERRGYEVERLRTYYPSRYSFNMATFAELGRAHARDDKRFQAEQPLLFAQ